MKYCVCGGGGAGVGGVSTTPKQNMRSLSTHPVAKQHDWVEAHIHPEHGKAGVTNTVLQPPINTNSSRLDIFVDQRCEAQLN